MFSLLLENGRDLSTPSGGRDEYRQQNMQSFVLRRVNFAIRPHEAAEPDLREERLPPVPAEVINLFGY